MIPIVKVDSEELEHLFPSPRIQRALAKVSQVNHERFPAPDFAWYETRRVLRIRFSIGEIALAVLVAAVAPEYLARG